jgi:hypothetical protein
MRAKSPPLRNFLRDRGYAPCPRKPGFNFGPRQGVLDGCRAQVQQRAEKLSERVSLIGRSLGRIPAREIAKEQPHPARCVITLGTPLAGHPRATNAWHQFDRRGARRWFYKVTHHLPMQAGMSI